MSNKLMTIPLCQLEPSTINVRKTNPLCDIEQMAASIESKGLLANLVVRQTAGKGSERAYEVIAGGRRLAALKLLAKRRKIGRDHAVPCRIVNGAEDADLIEMSLAENMVRAPMHPADQFDAFAKLQKEGLSADDIAARFGIAAALVLQRLKLAAVSPRLTAEYRAERMTLEQLMAFTISDDQSAQEQFWFENPVFDRSPDGIRRYLTRSHVDGTDRRARFVGAKAYEEAGGVIVRDLFEPEGGGYFTDSHLLDRLAAEKVGAEAEAIKAEGWGWIEVHVAPDYGYLAKFGRIRPTDVTLSKKEERHITRLCERYDELVTNMGEGGDDDNSAELDRVSVELDALRLKKEKWVDEEKRGAGVIISLEHDGTLRVDRGLVRPPESASESPSTPKRKAPIDGHPQSLLVDLSAERTAALREVVAGHPPEALTALLYTLVSDLFFHGSDSCVEIGVRTTDLSHVSTTVGQSKAAASLLARHTHWQALLPEHAELWDWLQTADSETRLGLLAYCVATTVNAVHGEGGAGRTADADRLARAVGLDMSEWWRPTSAGYFGRLTMETIIKVTEEACSPDAARRLSGLKKKEMTQAAESMMRDTRWIPKPLRIPPVEVDATDHTAE